MSASRSGGQAPDPQGDQGGPAEQAGVIEEIALPEAPTSRMTGSVWNRVLVGLFALAIVGGLIIAMSNAFGWTLGGNPAAGGRAATAQPSPSGPHSDPTITPLAPANVWTRTANRIGNTPQGGNTVGERYAFDCPPGGKLFPVFGTRVYTSDSSVCSAAVHWGLITVQVGGTVVIEIRPGHDAYRGTRRHGVISRDSGTRPRSFRFVES